MATISLFVSSDLVNVWFGVVRALPAAPTAMPATAPLLLLLLWLPLLLLKSAIFTFDIGAVSGAVGNVARSKLRTIGEDSIAYKKISILY